MKIKIIILFFACCISWHLAMSQDKRGYNVIYGGNGVIARFDGTNNKPVTGQLFSTPANLSDYVYVAGAHSCISDSAQGNLLFFCNSAIMYDTLGHIMENGDSLQPEKIYAHNCCPSQGQGVTQGSIILPKGSTNQYYVLVSTISDTMYSYWLSNPIGDGRFPFDILQYHVVDMNQNSGLGKVVQKNVRILEHVEIFKTGMMACKHANGYDWWLLKQGANTNTIYTFLVTKDTIVLDTIQSFPEPFFGYYDLAGQSCFNSDGSKYAFATGGYLSEGAHLYIADFDRCHGILSNVKEIKVPYDSTLTILDTLWQSYDSLITGICFSPNDSFLYVTRRYNLYQYDLFEVDSQLAMSLIRQGPDTVMLQKGQLHLGVDNRIYVGQWGGGGVVAKSVINKPNNKGAACDYCRQCLRCDTCDYTQSFANIPNFNMPKKEPCWPLEDIDIGESAEAAGKLQVYPNPSTTVVYIKNAKGKKKELYSITGQWLFSTYADEVDVSGWSKGVYVLSSEGRRVMVVVE